MLPDERLNGWLDLGVDNARSIHVHGVPSTGVCCTASRASKIALDKWPGAISLQERLDVVLPHMVVAFSEFGELRGPDIGASFSVGGHDE